MPFFAILWQYRKLALYGLLAASVAVGAIYLHHRGYAAGRAAVSALWAADTQSRDAATAKALVDAQAKTEAARKANEDIENDYQQKLAAISSDRDSLYRMLQRAQGQIHTLAADQATGKLGLDALAGIATRASKAEDAIRSQWDRYDAACQRDAVRFQALQDQLRPQL